MLSSNILTSNPVNRQHPLNRGLISWHLGPPWLHGGGTYWDVLGSRHGTLHGTLTWTQATHGAGGFSFGTGNYITMPNAQPSLLTVACWARSTSSSDAASMVSAENASGTHPFLLCLGFNFNTTGGLAVGIFPSPGWMISGIGAAGTAAHGDNQWHHFAGTFDGASLNFYVDGALDHSAGVSITTLPTNTSPIDIGRYNNNPDYFAGDIADVRIQDYPLSASDVAALYRESLAGYPTLLNRHRPTIFLLSSASGTVTAGTASFVSSGPGGISVSATEATGGTGPYTHQWQRNSDGGAYADLSGATSLTLTDTTATAGPLYGYQLVYTDTLSATATSNAVTAQIYSGGPIGGGGGTGTVFLTTAGGSVALVT